MAVQLTWPDPYTKANADAAYMRIESGSWQLGAGGFNIGFAIFKNKAAADAGAEPIHSGSAFVAFDSSGMTSSIEQAIMQRPEIAACSPVQVA